MRPGAPRKRQFVETSCLLYFSILSAFFNGYSRRFSKSSTSHNPRKTLYNVSCCVIFVSFFRIPSISAGLEEHRIAIRGVLTTKSPETLDITFIEFVEPTLSLEIRLFYLGKKAGKDTLWKKRIRGKYEKYHSLR